MADPTEPLTQNCAQDQGMASQKYQGLADWPDWVEKCRQALNWEVACLWVQRRKTRQPQRQTHPPLQVSGWSLGLYPYRMARHPDLW